MLASRKRAQRQAVRLYLALCELSSSYPMHWSKSLTCPISVLAAKLRLESWLNLVQTVEHPGVLTVGQRRSGFNDSLCWFGRMQDVDEGRTTKSLRALGQSRPIDAIRKGRIVGIASICLARNRIECQVTSQHMFHKVGSNPSLWLPSMIF